VLGQLSTQEIDQVLMTATVGRIGCHNDGVTYVVPVTYAYDGSRILAHSAEGLKVRMMRDNPFVCFEVEDVANLGNWKSVIAWGTFHELHDTEALAAMGLLIEKNKSEIMSETAMPQQREKAPERAVVYAIELNDKTGRFEKR